jgi:hypothetical protein
MSDKKEAALAGAAHRNTQRDRLSMDFRAPLWRGRWPATPEKLRRQFELYVLDFERYIEQRNAA